MSQRAVSNKKSHSDVAALENKARQIRATCVQMAFDAHEGHLSSALSCADLLVGLYHSWLNFSSDNPKSPDRDRFYFSKGHACTALYAIMAERGLLPVESLSSYGKTDSTMPNHPCCYALPSLEISSGSLGHGLGIAAGALYGLRLDGNPARAAVLMSDGECNEGSVWESAMFAAAQRLDRLLAVVDNNGLQAVGRSDALMGYTSLEEKFRAFGWAARTINGNNMSEVVNALADVPFASDRPSAIIARTRGGSGVDFMEDQVLWHYRVPSPEEYQLALSKLGQPPLHKPLSHA
jgi:transketolase